MQRRHRTSRGIPAASLLDALMRTGPHNTLSVEQLRDAQKNSAPTLVVISGPMKGECIVVEGPSLIGRDREADIRIADPAVSRRHALIYRDAIGLSIQDVESRHGVYVNDDRVEAARLEPDDVIRIGQTCIRVARADSPVGRAVIGLAADATRDSLTDTLSRGAFLERFKNALSYSMLEDEDYSVVMLDLDGLKPINDECGHDAGDRVLVAVAQRVSACARDGDLVGRLGGDEFALALRGASPAAAAAVMSRIEGAMRDPIAIDERVFHVSVSAGSASLSAVTAEAIDPESTFRAETLLELADERMYEAKRTKREDDSE